MTSPRLIASGLVPFAFVVLMMVYVFGPGSDILDLGVALPEITIEKIEFADSEIHATIRNTGVLSTRVVMADVNDRIQPAAIEPDGNLERYESALVRIPFEWNEAEPYRIGVTTEDGTRFEKMVEAAAPAVSPSSDLVGFFAIIGTFVGVVPVMIGLLWLPFIKKISKEKYYFFLALTVGLLLFLALDATEEAIDISNQHLSASFNGVLLIFTVIVLSFMGLYYVGHKMTYRAKIVNPLMVALFISIGIGLHNFGEGLAIGAAVGLGSIAFSTFLIVGFALHNTTEGVAIAAAASKGKTSLLRLAGLGFIAGTPAIFGVWIGGFAYSPFTSIIFLSVGVGAILQVTVVLVQWMRDENASFSSGPILGGLGLGILVMYLTSILA